MMAPNGVWMDSGVVVCHVLHTGVIDEKKCAVHPELVIA